MEKNVSDIVSFGIGAYETARQGAEVLLKNLETEINALIAQGETVQSENAVKVRAAASNASHQISTLVERAKSEYTNMSVKAQEVLANLQVRAKELAAKLPGVKPAVESK